MVINCCAKNYAKRCASQRSISPLGTLIDMGYDALDFHPSDEEKKMKREMILRICSLHKLINFFLRSLNRQTRAIFCGTYKLGIFVTPQTGLDQPKG